MSFLQKAQKALRRDESIYEINEITPIKSYPPKTSLCGYEKNEINEETPNPRVLPGGFPPAHSGINEKTPSPSCWGWDGKDDTGLDEMAAELAKEWGVPVDRVFWFRPESEPQAQSDVKTEKQEKGLFSGG